jgi:hypothetical protein
VDLLVSLLPHVGLHDGSLGGLGGEALARQDMIMHASTYSSGEARRPVGPYLTPT